MLNEIVNHVWQSTLVAAAIAALAALLRSDSAHSRYNALIRRLVSFERCAA